MTISRDEEEHENISLHNDRSKFSLEEEEAKIKEKNLSVGSIGSFDFVIWTVIPAIGIIFCLLHTEQEHFWQWTGETAKDAQSLEAKTVVSVISTVIGGCVVAIFMKTTVAVSYTILKYRGAHFSQLVAMIGGYSPSYIPMLTAGGGWISIIIIVLLLITSVVTKQLAVVSMGVGYYTTNQTMLSYTTNYTACGGIFSGEQMSGTGAVLTLNTLNTIINPNVTHSNEYYDKAIPASLQGTSNFTRVLPYANVSCVQFKSNPFTFPRYSPVFANTNTWGLMITIPLHDESNSNSINWVNCTVLAGHATANSSCNNTLCQTQRTSDITPYDTSITANGVPQVLSKSFAMLTPNSGTYRNPLLAWLKGGNMTQSYDVFSPVPGESFEVVRNRMEILITVVARIVCDVDYTGALENSTATLIQSYFEVGGYYWYHVLWKWPFWMIAGFIFISWIVCMFSMWTTPESRIMSVEWLLSQYIYRYRLCYLSGVKLVQAHEGSVFQVVDQNPDEKVGSIVISTAGFYKDMSSKIIQHKTYQ